MTTTIPPETIQAHVDVLRDWARANGLDPRDVPLDHPIRVEEGEGGTVIRYRAYVRTEHGCLTRSSDDPSHARTEARTTPCAVPLPPLEGLLPGGEEQHA